AIMLLLSRERSKHLMLEAIHASSLMDARKELPFPESSRMAASSPLRKERLEDAMLDRAQAPARAKVSGPASVWPVFGKRTARSSGSSPAGPPKSSPSPNEGLLPQAMLRPSAEKLTALTERPVPFCTALVSLVLGSQT